MGNREGGTNESRLKVKNGGKNVGPVRDIQGGGHLGVQKW